MKKKPLNVYEESIYRFMRRTSAPMTPTEIGKKIGIHPNTAKKNAQSLARKGLFSCKKAGKRLLCSITKRGKKPANDS